MNYSLSFGALIIFFLWVLGATFWWLRRMEQLERQASDLTKKAINSIQKDSNDSP